MSVAPIGGTANGSPAAASGSPAAAPTTLARKLSLRVAGLVAVVAILLSATSTVVVFEIQLRQIDATLNNALRTQNSAPSKDPDDRGPRGINQPGMPNGSAWITMRDSRVIGAQQISNGSRLDLTRDQINALQRVGDRPTSIQVPGLGKYRAVRVHRQIGGGTEVTIAAVSMSAMETAVGQLIGMELVLTLLAVLAAVVVSRLVVVRSLRPLQRLASAATAVSRLDLHQGEVELAVRVPPQDADATTEVGQVGRAFNHMLNNVESALAARHRSEVKVRQFVADASHELRNPLASIRGYAELTRRGREQLPTDAAFAMERIEAEADRMSSLVEDMLLLARLDNDPTLDLAPVDMVEVVLNAASDARAAWPDHEWRLSLPTEPVTVSADAFRLQQVVVNLLSNARRHTPPGTAVETSVSRVDGWGVVTVTDNGPGIPPTIRDHVFERFARADTSRAHTAEGSTGLGLAIVAAVMQAHHGTAAVSSEPGRTSFTLRFPLAP